MVIMVLIRFGLRIVMMVIVSSSDGSVSMMFIRCMISGLVWFGEKLVSRLRRMLGISEIIIEDRLISSDRWVLWISCESRLWFSLLVLSRKCVWLFFS